MLGWCLLASSEAACAAHTPTTAKCPYWRWGWIGTDASRQKVWSPFVPRWKIQLYNSPYYLYALAEWVHPSSSQGTTMPLKRPGVGNFSLPSVLSFCFLSPSSMFHSFSGYLGLLFIWRCYYCFLCHLGLLMATKMGGKWGVTGNSCVPWGP